MYETVISYFTALSAQAVAPFISNSKLKVAFFLWGFAMTFADSNGLLPSSAATPVMDARESRGCKRKYRRFMREGLIWRFSYKSLG
jgi:hypothetical protein